MSVWNWIATSEKQLKLLLACVAGLYAIFEYRNAVEREQVAEAMKLANSYTEGVARERIQRLRSLSYAGIFAMGR